ncbi:MAG: T9SS type A sorting domain-containing protein [Phaeodactylibacter sp.]|nr:T9SS type A sorting domain-containing protein [Phaeodactylibacter sp.]MCB9273607.1 T9SS type A sorting domain-containing protein [Lewinellaceae bacterium]
MKNIILFFLSISSACLLSGQVIFPGDLNNDGTANNLDLLPLGVAYGQEGPPRPEATLNWLQQPNFPWAGFLPVSGVNLGFVDADGNGFIDSLDLDAIALNYDSLQGASFPPPQAYALSDTFPVEELPELVIRFSRDTVAIGDTVTLTAEYVVPNPDVFPPTAAPLAIAFNLEFTDSLLAGEQVLIYPDTMPGDLMFVAATSNSAGIWRSPAPGQIEFAASGKGQPALASSRTLATMIIVMEDMILLAQPVQPQIKGLLLINTAEQVIAMKSTVAPLWLTGQSPEPERRRQMSVFPNPTTGRLEVLLPTPAPTELWLFSPTGQCLKHQSYLFGDSPVLELGAYSPGIYFLQARTPEGVQVERVVVGY